ncbi:MAG TPA: hypothetical protein VFV99_06120, partial [Kofleriaceae bacterium]|nr:hypothetical protein [Kofleriaceae bacterium]
MQVERWSLPRVVAFRFGVLAALLLVSPTVLWPVPGAAPLVIAIMRGWHWLATQFGALLGLDVPPLAPTGSGDALWNWLQALLSILLAVPGTLVWLLVDRRRAHPRLAAAMTVFLRYYLAAVLIGYGMAKVVPMQFAPLPLARYDTTLGEMSPMGLMWTFMAFSQPYVFFAGIAEVIGSVLLLSRRTYVAGALLLIVVMANVVVMNFCYDVPVKLFSMLLIVLLCALVAPHAGRLIGALLGYPTREVPPRVRGSVMTERVRLALKLAMVAVIAVRAYEHVVISRWVEEQKTITALHGTWRAERVVIDGIERPPLFTDDARWRKLIFHEWGLTVRFATDRRLNFATQVDATAQTINVGQGPFRQVWRYRLVDSEHLIIDTPTVRGELVLEPEPPLTTR